MNLRADATTRTLTRVRPEGEPAWLAAAKFDHALNADALARHGERAARLTGEDPHDLARDVMEEHLAAFAPRNRLERLLALQMLWQHARISRLVMLETAPSVQSSEDRRGVSAALDRALSTFARQTLTWTAVRAASRDCANELGFHDTEPAKV